jgi:hypothetical protein
MAGVLSGSAMLEAAAAAAPAIAYKADDLTYDLGRLVARDAHPVDPAALAADREATLQRVATENAQLLIKHVFELPVQSTDDGPVVSSALHTLVAPGWISASWRRFSGENRSELSALLPISMFTLPR